MSRTARLLPVVCTLLVLTGCVGVGGGGPGPGTITISNDDYTEREVVVRIVKLSNETDRGSRFGVPEYDQALWTKELRVQLEANSDRTVYRIDEPGTYAVYANVTGVYGRDGRAAMTHSFDLDTHTPYTGITGPDVFFDIDYGGELSSSYGAGE